MCFSLSLSFSLSPEGLLTVTDEELKEAGVEDPAHRATILSQLLRHKPILDPYSGTKHIYKCYVHNSAQKHMHARTHTIIAFLSFCRSVSIEHCIHDILTFFTTIYSETL